MDSAWLNHRGKYVQNWERVTNPKACGWFGSQTQSQRHQHSTNSSQLTLQCCFWGKKASFLECPENFFFSRLFSWHCIIKILPFFLLYWQMLLTAMLASKSWGQGKVVLSQSCIGINFWNDWGFHRVFS